MKAYSTKAYSTSAKAATGKINSYIFQTISGFNLKTRLAVLLIITALTTPMIFVGGWQQKTSAESIAAAVASAAPVAPAPVAAPPEPFVFPSSNTLSFTALSSVTTLGSSVSGAYSSIAGFFSAPELPAEFTLAKSVSPFSTLVSSTTSSLASFLGFAVTSKAATSAPIATAASTALMSQPAGSVWFDFDGDGKADIARWHRASGEWKARFSSNNSYASLNLGSASSLIAPGDFDGDHITDCAVFTNGVWSIRKSSNASIQTIYFGTTGDKPVVGDYDGDGASDVAIFRPSTSTWWIQNSGNGGVWSMQLGASGDIPVAGNYAGDGRTRPAVYRPSDGNWYVSNASGGYSVLHWGIASDIPVPADYDGDGRTDYAVFRGSTGSWYVYYTNGAAPIEAHLGNYGDQPTPADYDGDGNADLSVWRPTTGAWYTLKSSTGTLDGQTLGVPDDVAVPSAYIKQIGNQVYSYDFAKTRLSPKNAAGGTNLYSRNFSWGTGLVGLSGRAGMDTGFGISYNSLVWTKDAAASSMVFDADKANVAPGFRLGFPTIEPVYYDASTGKFNYMMITPSGGRVEFRQRQGASNIYETADSSYVQLKLNGASSPNEPAENITVTVTGTDGTQMTYAWFAGAYRCTQIKDANGNFITVDNDEYGLLRSVTDTLGRVVSVSYDGDFNSTVVTQEWKDNNGAGNIQSHVYATFNYAGQAVNPNFGGAITSIYGPQNTTIKVLQSIAFADGSSTKFDYNSYGQVYKVSDYAADNHLLNYTKTDLEAPAAGQSDCPRFSQTTNWVENFNQNSSGAAQPVVINNTITENTNFTIGGTSGTATKIEVSMTGEPNNHVSRTYVGAAGWTEGLPLATEDLATENGSYGQRRWTTTAWTQDNTALSYIQNPRTTESKVGDASNVKKTTVDYITQSGVTLPYQVKAYDTNQTTVLKTSATEYNWSSFYLSRRIIGLPAKSELYDRDGALVSKVTYAYDEGDFNDTTLNQNLSSAIQHDNTNYGAGFITGRGNLTSTTRWDVTGQTASVTSNVKYNTAGAVVAQITPGSTAGATREVKIDYTDSFNDNQNRNTFAYPKKITDPAGNFSEVKYRYDTGANVWAKSPAPQNQQNGKTSERIFDALGRLQKQSVVNNGGAYTRYEYPASQNYSRVFSTITDVNNNGADAADEILSESYTDGAGRVRQSRTELPNSAGGWSGQKTEYDILGQVKRQSVPTEIDSNWTPAGDDYARGWLWTQQEYDWKGRVTRTVNTDGTDKLISYEGCGCAGGQVTTVKGENIVESDWQNNNQTALGRRTQKIYDDILGRTYKTEVMSWDGTTPYTTTVNTFNGRDQVTQSNQYAGTTGSSIYRAALMTYDGHGRIKTQHRPEQNAGTAAVYNYNADDSIESVVDARGASVNYTYNSRGLVEQISSAAPGGSNIPLSPTVSFVYDNIGNRTSMADGLGSVAYEYNQLSQLTAETRQFTDSLPNAPLAGNGFKLEYDYALSGQLKSLKDPFGQQFNYAYDKVGRLNSVAGGSAFAGISTYASNPQYNARGTLTALNYGNGAEMAITGFNNKLQATDFEVKKGATSIIKKQYQFYGDGSLKFSKDVLDAKFDRLYKYDHLGRTVQAKSGVEARGGTDQSLINIPYNFQYGYNHFGQITGITGRYYSTDNNIGYTFDDASGRGAGETYDAEGNVVSSGDADYAVDAAGRSVSTAERDPNTGQPLAPTVSYFDGSGEMVKRIRSYAANGNNAPLTNYYIRSSVLNKIISETDGVGKKLKTFVSANGVTLAEQSFDYNQNAQVNFIHQDPSGSSVQQTTASGALSNPYNRAGEYDALGRNVADASPYIILNTEPPTNEGGSSGVDMYGSGEGFRPGQQPFLSDGMPVTQAEFMAELSRGRGGSLGVLEMFARMSTRVEGYRIEEGYFVRGSSHNGPPSLRRGGGGNSGGGLFDSQERIITAVSRALSIRSFDGFALLNTV